MHHSGEFSHDSSFSLLVGELLVSEPLLLLRVLVGLALLSCLDSLADDLLGFLVNLLSITVAHDRFVNLLVEILTGLATTLGQALVPNSELSVIFVLVLLLELGHVGENVVTEDSISVLGSLELGLLLLGLTSCLTSLVDNLLNLSSGITRESLGRVRNVDATISSTL